MIICENCEQSIPDASDASEACAHCGAPLGRISYQPTHQRDGSQITAPLCLDGDGTYTVHITQPKNNTWIVFVVLAAAITTALLSVGAALLISYTDIGQRQKEPAPIIVSGGPESAKVITDNNYVKITFTGESYHFDGGMDFPVNIESKYETCIWLSLTEVRINGSPDGKVEINNDDIAPFTIIETFIHFDTISDLTELIEFSAVLNIYDCETLKKIDSVAVHYSYRLLI